MIKNIKIRNFRSFEELEIDLNNLNVVIGANASGKSNFVNIFQFLRDIANHGLANAISLQGGFEYLTNINLSDSEEFYLQVISDTFSIVPVKTHNRNSENKLTALKVINEIYEFSLKYDKKNRFEILNDKLSLEGDFVELEFTFNKDDNIENIKEKKINPGKIFYSKVGNKIDRYVEGFDEPISDEIALLMEKEIKPNTILLENSENLRIIPRFGTELFEKISIYDFDPKLPKRSVPRTGKTELENDGKNLAIVLKNIIDDPEKYEIFSGLIRNVLPFVSIMQVDKSKEDNSFQLKLQETCSNKFLPAQLISDGTINLTALITALYFEEKPLIIVEEPERNIHPQLISKLAAMINEASADKQIIITTHNPEIIKHIKLEDIILISRPEKRFSVISRPHEKDDVKRFLENKIGIDTIYARRLVKNV